MKWESQQRVLVRRRGNKIIIQDHIEGEPIMQGDKKAKFTISQDGRSLSFDLENADPSKVITPKKKAKVSKK